MLTKSSLNEGTPKQCQWWMRPQTNANNGKKIVLNESWLGLCLRMFTALCFIKLIQSGTKYMLYYVLAYILAFTRYCLCVVRVPYLCSYNAIIIVIYKLAMSPGHICCLDSFLGPRTFRDCQLWGSFLVGIKYPELWSIYFLLIFRVWSLSHTNW